MSFIQNKKIANLVNNLIKDGFKDYLQSKNFKENLEKLNLIDLWKLTEDYLNNISFLLFSFRGKTEIAPDTFGIFIEKLYNEDKDKFLKNFIDIIKDFLKFKGKEVNLNYIEKLLKPLGFTYDKMQNYLN
ncbi:MAG: hypothetical protein N3D74_02675 [Caldisericia bacterium]|nr:hypothetical protein [Caldisericia bacterium]